MKTVTIEVNELLSALSARGVEKQLSRLPGVAKVEVNYVAGSATVVYDETEIYLAAIKARVSECGYHCSGERVPHHVCVPEDPPAADAAQSERAPDALACVPPSRAARSLQPGLAVIARQWDAASGSVRGSPYREMLVCPAQGPAQ